jgi:SAM-dependent methyltransferase
VIGGKLHKLGLKPTKYYYYQMNKIIRLYRDRKINVLKCDVYNELKNDPYEDGFINMIQAPNASYHFIEYDIGKVMKIRKKRPYMNVTHGDIRDLPYKNGMFDVVADLSTIDHVKPDSEMPTVIGEYYRVLKPNGTLLIVAWCGMYEEVLGDKEKEKWHAGMQYQLRLKSLRKEMLERFDVWFEDKVIICPKKYLYCMIGEKRF